MSGLFGVVSKEDCVKTLFYGTDYHSHMGTQRAGLAVLGEAFQRSIHDITDSQFKSKFAEEYKRMRGMSGIGVISDRDPQPLVFNSRFGMFAVAGAGLVSNIDVLARELQEKGHSFSENSDGTINAIELVTKLINEGKSLIDGIERMHRKIAGSMSVLILCKDGIYAARDRFGRSPLVVAERDGAWAVASESCALPNLGFSVRKFVAPGEILLLTESGLKGERPGGDSEQICSFLWIYTGYPASSYGGIGVETVREQCGALLAGKNQVTADLVAGVPDSGVGHAIGYAMQSGIPYRRPLVKYSYGYGRSYTPPSQEIRDLVATMKLVAIRDIIEGNRIILCEDSIVRGTQLRNLTIRKLWDNGAREIHLRVACPPLMYPCKYALSTRSLSELAARRAIHAIEGKDLEDVREYLDPTSPKYRRMVEWIRDDLGVSSLDYLSLDDMIRAIGLPKEKLCLHCWIGEGA